MLINVLKKVGFLVFSLIVIGFLHRDKTEEFLIGIKEAEVSLKANKIRLKKEISDVL